MSHLGQQLGWKTDETLYPDGWRYKEIDRKGHPSLKLMSQSGIIFPSIRTALVHVVGNNFHEDDVAKIRKALVTQKVWLSHPELPENWMYQRSNNSNSFCDPNGQKYGSKDLAIKSVENPDTIAMLNRFKAEKNPTKSNLNFDESWKFDEEVYPRGWRFKDVKRNGIKIYQTIVSHDGVTFKGKREALAYIIKNNYSDEDKEKLSKEGFFNLRDNVPFSIFEYF